MHLFAAALGKRRRTKSAIPALYIAVPSSFPVLEDFIQKAAEDYGLDLFVCRPPAEFTQVETVVTPSVMPSVGKAKGGQGMRDALAVYKDAYPNIKGILIGTRRTDPHGGGLACVLRFLLLSKQVQTRYLHDVLQILTGQHLNV